MKMDGRGIAGEILELFARLKITFADLDSGKNNLPHTQRTFIRTNIRIRLLSDEIERICQFIE